MFKKLTQPKKQRGRPKSDKPRILCKKMFLVEDSTNEILRNTCFEHRIPFSELVREMIEHLIDKKWKYFSANYRGE